MPSIRQLDNLVRIDKLKQEPPARAEFKGLIRLGKARLVDALNEDLSNESRFDLAYNAAHALSLAALRWHGYRSQNRYVVFQALEHTLGFAASKWRLLAESHQARNLAEYGGVDEVDQLMLENLLEVAGELLEAVDTLEVPNDLEG